jgi:hypothetical protein
VQPFTWPSFEGWQGTGTDLQATVGPKPPVAAKSSKSLTRIGHFDIRFIVHESGIFHRQALSDGKVKLVCGNLTT